MTPLTREQVEILLDNAKHGCNLGIIRRDNQSELALVALCEDWLRMRTALDDFANHGFRADYNPTGVFHDCGHFTLMNQSWQNYLKSIDDSVRERARQALGRGGG